MPTAPATGGSPRQEFEAIKAQMAKYADVRVAEAEGFTVQQDLAFYHGRNEPYAHVHGPATIDGHYLELMYEILPNGTAGKLAGIMQHVNTPRGGGGTHSHGNDGAMQHIWFRLNEGGIWRDVNPNDPADLAKAFRDEG